MADDAIAKAATTRRLVVVVPGIAGGLATWSSLLARLKQEPALAGATWVEWHHGLHPFSVRRLTHTARELRAHLDAQWSLHGPFGDVTLMGHSVGGVLVRAAYLLALGVGGDVPRVSDWGKAVHRIVLFAALNRGVNGLNEPDDKGLLAARITLWCFRMFPPLRRFTSYDMMRGSDFITNLRIQWIREVTPARAKDLVVVQLLGTRDTIVTRADSLDVEQFRHAWHADIADATHADLHRIDKAPDPAARYAVIKDAVLGDVPPGINAAVTGPERAVFILHGIRANNDTWAHDLKDAFEACGITAITPTYGYFSALKFAVPAARRKHLHWFQDRYTEQVSRNPGVKIDFVGHSNGTYLLGQSLLRIPGMQFDKVLLAGSVLPTNYPWRNRFENRQLTRLWNLRANRDVPVSFLCSALRGLGMRDVGTGGFAGFQDDLPPQKAEMFWYDGGHGAALERDKLDIIVDYVSRESADASAVRSRISQQDSWRHRLSSRLAPWVARGVMAGVVLALAWWVFGTDGFSLTRFAISLAVVAAVLIALDTA